VLKFYLKIRFNPNFIFVVAFFFFFGLGGGGGGGGGGGLVCGLTDFPFSVFFVKKDFIVGLL
jgi:hypothetical protein